MTSTLLHAIARKGEAITPDSELLARYLGARDESAFAELVRRHGPLVWAVCRQMVPNHADAEDAFQAVFLTLVRSAASIREGCALPAWLHGVAVRVVMRARREFARRRARERRAATAEADRPISDEAWNALAAVVHEEVQKLPQAERTAFVLCELQGVSQSEAAEKLGWPLGSVSGRLCKARQRLLDRLSARGVAPAAVVGLGITAGAVRAVPASLFEVVKGFPSSPGAASPVVSALARGLVEGMTMRVKLMAATVFVAGALGATGGAVWLSTATAQQPGASEPGQPPGVGNPNNVPGFPAPGGAPPGTPGVVGVAGEGAQQPGGGDKVPPGEGNFNPNPNPKPKPGKPGMMPGGGGMAGFGTAAWEYKFVEIQADRKEFETTITKYGKEGWEYCGSERFITNKKSEFVLVFKKHTGGFHFGGQSVVGGFSGFSGQGGIGGFGPPGMAGGQGGLGFPGAGGIGSGFQPRAGNKIVAVLKLEYANPDEVIAAIRKALPKGAQVNYDPKTESLFITIDSGVTVDVNKIVKDLEAKFAKSGTKPKPGAGGPKPGGPDGSPLGMSGPPGGKVGVPMGGAKSMGAISIYSLKFASAADLIPVLTKFFPNLEMTAEPRTNSLVVRSTDAKALEELKALLEKLDVDVNSGKTK